MSMSQENGELGSPSWALDGEGQEFPFIPDSLEQQNTRTEEEYEFDDHGSQDARTGVGNLEDEFQQQSLAANHSMGKHTQAPPVTTWPRFERPESGGKDISAGFHFATAPNRQRDLLGRQNGHAINNGKATQVDQPSELGQPSIVPRNNDPVLRNDSTLDQPTAPSHASVPLKNKPTAPHASYDDECSLHKDGQGSYAETNDAAENARLTDRAETSPSQDALDSRSATTARQAEPPQGIVSNHPIKQAETIADSTRQQWIPMSYAQAQSFSHIQGLQNSIPPSMCAARQDQPHNPGTADRPLYPPAPNPLELKIPIKGANKKKDGKKSTKQSKKSKSNLTSSTMQPAREALSAINGNTRLVVNGSCADGFTGDILPVAKITEGETLSKGYEAEQPNETSPLHQTGPAVSAPSMTSAGMQSRSGLTPPPPETIRNTNVASSDRIGSAQSHQVPPLNPEHPHELKSYHDIEPDSNKVRSGLALSLAQAQRRHTEPEQTRNDAPDTQQKYYPPSTPSVQEFQAEGMEGQHCRTPTPRRDPSESLHRVSESHKSVKVGKSKVKVGARTRRSTAAVLPPHPGGNDETDVTLLLKMAAWKMEGALKRRAETAEAAVRPLEAENDRLMMDNDLLRQDRDQATQNKKQLEERLRNHGEVVRGLSQKMQNMEKFADAMGKDINQCFAQRVAMQRQYEELNKEAETYRDMVNQLKRMTNQHIGRATQVVPRIKQLRSEACHELDQLTQWKEHAETRLGELSGTLAEERDRSTKSTQALNVALKNNRIMSDIKKDQQAILGQLSDLHQAFTEFRPEDTVAREKLDECLQHILTVQAVETVHPSDVHKVENLVQTMMDSLCASLDQLRVGSAESLAAQSTIRTCVEEHFATLKADSLSIESVKAQNVELREEKAALNARLLTLESSLSNKCLELKNAKDTETSLGKKIFELETKEVLLKNELETRRNASVRTQEMEHLVATLQNDLAKAKSDLTEETEKRRAAEAAESQSHGNDDWEGLQSRLAEAEERIAVLEDELSENARQAAENLEATKADCEKTAQKRLEDATTKLENELHQQRHTAQHAEKVAKKERENADLWRENMHEQAAESRSKDAEITRLKERISEVEQMLQKCEESQRKSAALNERQNPSKKVVENRSPAKANATRPTDHAGNSAMQTKTPPNTTNHSTRHPRRKATPHISSVSNMESVSQRTEGSASLIDTINHQSSSIVPATYWDTEAELTNMSQLESVDENGVAQVTLRDTAPNARHRSEIKQFADSNEDPNREFLSSSGLSEPPSSAMLPPGGQGSYNTGSELPVSQRTADNSRISTPQRFLQSQSPQQVRPNSGSRVSRANPQNPSQSPTLENSSLRHANTSQTRGHSTAHSKANGVHFPPGSGSSPDALSRQATGSQNTAKPHQNTHPASQRTASAQNPASEHPSKPATLQNPSLKRGSDSMQQAPAETSKRSKLTHRSIPTERAVRQSSYVPGSPANPGKSSQVVPPSNPTSRSPQHQSRQSAPPSRGSVASAKRAASSVSRRTTRQMNQRFGQELDKH